MTVFKKEQNDYKVENLITREKISNLNDKLLSINEMQSDIYEL